MNSQQAHKKVLNITKHHGNANQNHSEIAPHIVTMTIIKKTRRNKCGPECGEKGALVHCWWVCDLAVPLWEVLKIKKKKKETQKIKNRTTI